MSKLNYISHESCPQFPSVRIISSESTFESYIGKEFSNSKTEIDGISANMVTWMPKGRSVETDILLASHGMILERPPSGARHKLSQESIHPHG